MRVRQCVILAGGAGTRLGSLTRDIPKPLLPVAGRPFLEHLILKAARHGFDRALLLVGHHAAMVEAWLSNSDLAAQLGIDISLSSEPRPLGTGGAVAFARPQLDEAFLLINGDTWFDFDWRVLADQDGSVIALRQIPEADRYETVQLEGKRAVAFVPRSGIARPGLINGGVYRLIRDTIPATDVPASLEAEILPALCKAGQLGARIFEGPFIDIGLPESYAAAQTLLA